MCYDNCKYFRSQSEQCVKPFNKPCPGELQDLEEAAEMENNKTTSVKEDYEKASKKEYETDIPWELWKV